MRRALSFRSAFSLQFGGPRAKEPAWKSRGRTPADAWGQPGTRLENRVALTRSARGLKRTPGDAPGPRENPPGEIQGLVPERASGFDSPLRHHLLRRCSAR